MAKKTNNGANLGFENKLREMADKMRGHMDSGEYKHVVLGLIFLKYISDAFQGKYDALAATLESDYKCERVAWHPDRIDHDGDCVTIHSLDAAINGTIEDGVFCVVGVEWYGEGSGTTVVSRHDDHARQRRRIVHC